MLHFAYDGSINGDWVSHYAVQLASAQHDRTLRLIHFRGGQILPTILEDKPGQHAYRSATGITLASIVLMQIGNVVGRRSLRHSGLGRGLLANPLLLSGIATEILFSRAILYVPAVQSVLHTGPVAPTIYALAWFGIPVMFILDYARKRLAAHWDRRRAEPGS